jgi:type IV pilus assembly protein PilE
MNGCRPSEGFTLLELMITVAIVAILAAIAYPGYRQHIIHSKRSAAETAMMDLANREQQYLLANRTYADTATLTANGYSPPGDVSGDYQWTVTAPAATPPTFLITFTPKPGSGQASDVVLTLSDDGTKTPANKW